MGEVITKKEAVWIADGISLGAVNIKAIARDLIRVVEYEEANHKDSHKSALVAIIVDQLGNLLRHVDIQDAYDQLREMKKEVGTWKE